MVNTIRSILIALALLIALETQSFALNNADEYLELYSKCCRNGLVYSNQDCDSQVQRFYWDNMPPEQRSRPIMSGKVPRGLNFLLMPPERELSDLCANPSKYLSCTPPTTGCCCYNNLVQVSAWCSIHCSDNTILDKYKILSHTCYIQDYESEIAMAIVLGKYNSKEAEAKADELCKNKPTPAAFSDFNCDVGYHFMRPTPTNPECNIPPITPEPDPGYHAG